MELILLTLGVYWKVSRIKPFLPVCQCFPVFCVCALELSTLCLGTCILLSLCDPVFPPPWVGCDPASPQLPQVTNSHPGVLVIQGMYFSTLYALCPFLKFTKNLTGHRSSYQTEFADKNSNRYIGHLKIQASVHSDLEDTLFCWQSFVNFWHFVPMSQEWEAVLFFKKEAWWCRCLFPRM